MMSHEMVGYNNDKKQIAYLRFTMGDPHADIMYDLLDANQYNGGVSGIGQFESFSLLQLKKTMKTFQAFTKRLDFKDNEFLIWQNNEIEKFLNQCVETAEKEKSVHLLFA